MASTDAKPVPQKNVAYRVTFPILDADGDLVTGATGLDSEVSKDGGTFADCTNEATEIATSSGVYYLDLTSTEMNADTVAVIIKTSSSGAKTTTIVMYPEEAGDIRVNVTQFGGTNGTFASGRPEVNTTHFGGSALTQSSGRPEVNTTHAAGTAWGSGAITAGALASDAITAAKLASDVTTELQNGLATAAALSAVDGKIDTIDTNVDAILVDTGTDIPATLATIAGYLDTEIAAIKAKTDQLAFTTANRVDAQVFGMQAGTVTAAAVATDAIDADALAADALAEIKAQAVAALITDTYAEPGQGAPAATASIKDKIGYLFKAWRNKTEQSSTEYSLYADDGSTKDQKASVSDNGTLFTRGEVSTGA